MSLLESIIMGLIQGLTEFLPVSSSGHLAIFKNIFHVNTETGLLFDVLLHIGTLLAIFIIYWKDVKQLILEGISILGLWIYNIVIIFTNLFTKNKKQLRPVITTSYRRFVIMILISTVPTGIMGILLERIIGKASEALILPGICLIITSILLFIADKVKVGNKNEETASYGNAITIGVAQGVATLPGLSRSGTTITTCLLCGFDREFAVKYSFIMSIPAILGAALLQLKDIKQADIVMSQVGNYVIGMLVAAVVGYICIKTMLVVVKKSKFKVFAFYCLIVGVASVVCYFVL